MSAQALRQVDGEFQRTHLGQDDEARARLLVGSGFFYDARGVPTRLFTPSSKEDFNNNTLNANTKALYPELYASANRRQESFVAPKGIAALKELGIGTAKGVANIPSGLANIPVIVSEGYYNLGRTLFGKDYDALPKVPNLFDYATPGEEVAGFLGPIALSPLLARTAPSSVVTNEFNTAKKVADETEALQRIGQRPPGADLSLKEPNSVLLTQAESISTAKLSQSTVPRDLSERLLLERVLENPSAGQALKGLAKDQRFAQSAGFTKMQASHELPNGSNITIHYQYNSITDKAYDIKFVTPQASVLQPGRSITK